MLLKDAIDLGFSKFIGDENIVKEMRRILGLTINETYKQSEISRNENYINYYNGEVINKNWAFIEQGYIVIDKSVEISEILENYYLRVKVDVNGKYVVNL